MSRSYDAYKAIRKPMAPPAKRMKSKKDYNRKKVDWKNETDE